VRWRCSTVASATVISKSSSRLSALLCCRSKSQKAAKISGDPRTLCPLLVGAMLAAPEFGALAPADGIAETTQRSATTPSHNKSGPQEPSLVYYRKLLCALIDSCVTRCFLLVLFYIRLQGSKGVHAPRIENTHHRAYGTQRPFAHGLVWMIECNLA
jgi:hypothetical protein